MPDVSQKTLNPEIIEGNYIRKVQLIAGAPPTLVMELEDQLEQRAILTIVPSAVPTLNGNLLLVNASITLTYTKKEAN